MAGQGKRKELQKKETGKKPLPITAKDISHLTPQEIQILVEQLHIHQVELQAQIEEQQRIQEELEYSRNKYQELYDSVPVGYLTIDINNSIQEANITAAEMLGTERLHLRRSKFTSFIAPTRQSQDTFYLHTRDSWKSRLKKEFELDLQRRDGSRFPACLIAVPVEHIAGNRRQLRIALTDITERKRSEKTMVKARDELELKVKERTFELSQSEEKFRRIFETANESIWIIDLQGKILMANNQVSQTLGYPLEEIIGHVTNDFLVKKQENLIVGKMRKALHRGAKLTFERRLRHKNGSMVYLLVNSAPLIDREGRHIANMGMMTDITYRKKAEKALIETKAELEKANEQLKAYGQRITRVQEEERKKIAYELHDDTAQYLAILKLQLDSIIHSGEIQSPKLIEKLRHLEKDAGRAVDDIRRYSHELRPGVLEHLGLQAALEQIAEDHNKMGQIQVDVNVEGEEPDLSEDIRLGFFRITQEAINNCRKHARASQATINLEFANNKMRLIVNDNGIGFNVQEALARIGEKGSLGLMSMQERAKIIGASLSIESQPGEGTTVTLEMPLENSC